MVITMALCLVAASVVFGGVTIRYLAPALGLAMLLTVLWVGKLVFAERISWIYAPMHWPVAAFALYTTVRYFTSPIEYDSRFELILVGLYTVIYFTTCLNFCHTRDRTVIVMTLLGLGVAEALFGLWQFGTNAETLMGTARYAAYLNRGSGTYVCPNHLAGLLEIILLVLVGRVAIRHGRKETVQETTLKKVFLVYLVLVIAAGLLSSMSRGGIVATAVGLCAFLVWRDRGKRLPWLQILTIVAGLLVLGGLLFSLKPVRERVLDTFRPKKPEAGALADVTLGGRTMMWKATLSIIRDHPLLGTGPATWQWFHLKYRDPKLEAQPEFAHHDVLNLTSDYGVVGLLLVLAALGCFFYHATILTRRPNQSDPRSFAAGCAMAVTAILVHSFSDFNLHIPANALLLITLMGMTCGMEDAGGHYRRSELNRLVRVALALALLSLVGLGIYFGTPMMRASYYNDQGNDADADGDWDEAVEHYQKAIQYDPTFPSPYLGLGKMHQLRSSLMVSPEKKERREQLAREALAAFERGLALNPLQSEVWLRPAMIHNDVFGDHTRALELIGKALAVDPNNALAWQKTGIVYQSMGEKAKAIEALEKSFKLGSDVTTFELLRYLKAEP